MAPPPPDVPLPPPVIKESGTWGLKDITSGCMVAALRAGVNANEWEERRAEILSIRTTKDNSQEFFVHWDQFNKRLDEWIPQDRVLLTKELELPRPKPSKVVTAHATPNQKQVKGQPVRNKKNGNLGTQGSMASVGASPGPGPSKGSLKRKQPHDELDEDGADGEADGDMTLDLAAPVEETHRLVVHSKQEEIEKLRTSGSMTQSLGEIARVKNLNRIQIGRHEVEAWYFSPYPREFAHEPLIYICEFCLGFAESHFRFQRHRLRCTLLHPPGNEIYRHEDISFFEIDGKKQPTWCRNLSLLSKLFLDHKTLYYDVQPFLYYVMTKRDDQGCHIIGYFSKEKESAENYNVACILTLPQHQRHGYGKLLIEFSYELSKREGKLGSPEKPLSDLGLLSYRAYWAETILDVLLNNGGDDISIDDIAHKTSITHADIMNTCKTLELFKHYNGQNVIFVSEAVKAQHERSKAKKRRRIVSECLLWKPPTFTRDQLRFAY
ncbi:acyl-CoA N-acyltransferase [Auriculariales sp. MPI-PUGE-AT-0066]|nr:acyl-CoA N-acyltransferase [Auriculariales sp. MPI-PUGE-AT-0066]